LNNLGLLRRRSDTLVLVRWGSGSLCLNFSRRSSFFALGDGSTSRISVDISGDRGIGFDRCRSSVAGKERFVVFLSRFEGVLEQTSV
jgi:hypothetical protein